MATLRDAFKTILTDDATLTALLTGGIKDASNEPKGGFGLKDLAKELDGVRIQPFALIRWRDSVLLQPDMDVLSPEKESVEIYVYQDKGFATIESAVNRLKVLLHRQLISADDREFAYCHFEFVSGEVPAEEYDNASMKFIRFNLSEIRSF